MKLRNRIKQLRDAVGTPYFSARDIWLYLAVFILLTVNSVGTVGMVEYLSTQKQKKNNDRIANNYVENISDRLLVYLENVSEIENANLSEQAATSLPLMLKEYVSTINPDSWGRVAIIDRNSSIVASNLERSSKEVAPTSKDLLVNLQQNLGELSTLDRAQKLDLQISQQAFSTRVIPWENRELDVKYLVVVSIPRSTLPIDYIIEQQSWRSQSKIYLLPGIISGTIGSLGLILLLDRLNRLKQDRLSAESTSASVPATPEPTVSVSGDQEFKNSQQAGTTKPANSTEAYQLLAHMSHELRSPLNGILGFAQIIEQESLMTQANRENIAMIAHSGDRLLLIVNDVVDLAKIEIGQLTLEHNNFDFDSWLHKVEQNFKSQAQNQGWEFSLTKKADLPQYICIDERRLRQVIKNLINYCLKSNLLANIRLIVSSYPKTPATTNTNLDGQDNRHTIEFKFDCTNCSVKTAELATLFDPIIRVKQGQEYAQGSSLSLPISRKLAQLMGGDLTVEASDTSKSSLVFNLTIQAESVAAQKLQIQSTMKRIVGLESNQTEYRILVVDDSKTNRKIMSQLLGSVGFKVKEAVNGSEAIDQWLRWQPHMIWMDLRMPVMNGYEATERIKSSSPNVHIPIVALSASTLEEEKAMFQAAGCDDFVGKPFSDQIIFDKIAQHLGIRYIYESSLPNPLESESSSFKLTADALNVMSNHWLNQVEQAANELNRDLLTQLIEEIPSEYTYLKNALQSQVNNFDFDSILNLIKNSQNN